MADAGKIVITPKGKYNSTTTYEWLDEVTYDGKAYIALKTVTGVTPSDDGVNWRLFLDPNDIVAGNLVPTFTEASTRSNIISEENLSTILGKVKKYFTDLKGHAFNDTVKNLTTENIGSALDASQGKILKDEVDGVNSNLDTLAYGENCGGKNIWKYDNYFKDYCGYAQNGNEFYGETSNILKMPNIYLADNNSQYTISFDGKHETAGDSGISAVVDYTDGTLDYVPVTSDVVSYKKFTLTTNPNKTISLIRFSYGSYKAGTSYIKNFQIEKGSSATDYEPYIMSNRQLTQQNESLDDYGLNNKFDGTLNQGYDTNGSITENNMYVCSNRIPCTVGGIVNIEAENNNKESYITWYNGTTYKGRATISASNEIKATVPSDVTHFRFSIGNSNGITPTTAGHIGVYVDNAIDELKNDLSDVKIELLCEELQITGVNDNIYIVSNNSFVKNGVAFVDILFSELSNINEDTTLFTINKPKFSLYYNHYDYEFTIAVNKDGQVIASKLINSKDVRFQAIYPIE